jgi:hypothetical protein
MLFFYQPKKISEIFASEPRLNGVGLTPMTERGGRKQSFLTRKPIKPYFLQA